MTVFWGRGRVKGRLGGELSRVGRWVSRYVEVRVGVSESGIRSLFGFVM